MPRGATGTMAGTFVVAPNGFELVGDPVPAQHWLTLHALPLDSSDIFCQLSLQILLLLG